MLYVDQESWSEHLAGDRPLDTRSVIVLLAAAFLFGCGEDLTGPEAVSRIEVAPSSVTLSAFDETQKFTAKAFNSSGSTVRQISFSWKSTNPEVASIDDNGVATATGNGTTSISASVSNSDVSGSATLTVDQEVASLTVFPPTVRLEALGATVGFSVEALDKNENTVAETDVSWTSRDTTIVRIDSTGTAVGSGEGITRIVGTTNGVRDSAGITLVARGRLAYASYRNGNHEIYTIQPNGLKRRRLTNHPEADFAPTWSPDGEQVAFLSKRDPAGLYRMSADGTNISLITGRAFTGIARPEWSPDGSRIVFRTEDDKLATIQPDGNNFRVVVDFQHSFGRFPTWSPGSDSIAFVYDRTGDVWTTGVSSSSKRSLDVWGSDPKWSPDGGKIVFFYTSDGKLSTMDPDGSDITPLTPGTNPTWSPRGQWIAFFHDGDLVRVRRGGADRKKVLGGGFFWKTPAWRPLPEK